MAAAWRPAASTTAFASGRSAPEAKENTNPILYSRFAHEGAVVKLVYSLDGKTLVSTGEDRSVKIWDAEPMVERRDLERQSDWAGGLAISPDGKQLAVGRLDGSLTFYDLATGNVIPPPPPPKPLLANLSIRGVQSRRGHHRQAFGQQPGECFGRQDEQRQACREACRRCRAPRRWPSSCRRPPSWPAASMKSGSWARAAKAASTPCGSTTCRKPARPSRTTRWRPPRRSPCPRACGAC